MTPTTPPGEPERLRRFYTAATVGPPDDAGHAAVLLDGRPLKTPRKRTLLTPIAIAAGIAAEWQAQDTLIEPGSMPLTRLANTAIDGVAEAADAVMGEIVAVASNDLVAYRADAPDGLVANERAAWDPLVTWAGETLGVALRVTDGLMPIRQPDALGEAVRGRLPADPLALAATHVIAHLTGSAIITLAIQDRHLDAEAAWRAAHVEEDWNIAEWGEDEIAAARRESRKRDFDAAIAVLKAAV